MNSLKNAAWTLGFLAAGFATGVHGAQAVESQSARQSTWPFPILAAHRAGTYWWCPGSAFTKTDIDWNLQQLQEAGFGFVHVVPIYGARGAEERYIPYLSPQWMEMLDYIVRRAQSLGLFVDMTTGTGWCFGGPGLPADAVDARAHYDPKTQTVALVPAMRVKRAAPGGEGPMLNPFSPRSMTLYLERFSAAFDSSKAALPRAQYHDSFEYRADWCAELLDEFKSRRGYDLRDHLPAFFADRPPGDADLMGRVKCDYRQVLSDLHREAIERWTSWAHARGMVTRDQAHGAPANLLDVYATADIPETEMFGTPEFAVPGVRCDPNMSAPGDCDMRICMLAASAAHVAHSPGKQLVCSESCTWLAEHWHATLAQIKLELDLLFLAGVNQVLFHGTCYSPKEAPWPGWFFYASVKMDGRNAFWRDVRFLTDYVARCQSVLQAGQPANDVLVYWPIYDLWMDPHGTSIPLTVHRRDWMAKQRVGQVAEALVAKGFAFDFLSDRMIQGLKAEGGKLVAPGGNYRALVVPACKYMPDSTLERLADLAGAGAPVIFEREFPADVPGLADLTNRRARLATQRARLAKSGAIVAPDAISGLERAKVPRESMTDIGLRCIRRKIGASLWYFIANLSPRAIDGWVPLAAPCASAMLFDPLTGRSGLLACSSRPDGVQVYLQLAPGETALVRADSRALPGEPWPYLKPQGPPVVLEGQWSVQFIEGGPALPAAYRTCELGSWTKAPDARAQAFAGTARYTLRFPAPAQHAEEWLLDLGDVRHSARVRLNGQTIAALVAVPFRARVGPWLKQAENLLEIEVTNLSANRIRDLERRKIDWKIMKDINIVNIHYKPLDPSRWPIEESGLLGPVRLLPHARLTPTP